MASSKDWLGASGRLRITGVAALVACILGFAAFAVQPPSGEEAATQQLPVPRTRAPKPPPTAMRMFSCAAADHPPSVPAPSSTNVSAVVIGIPFVESVTTKHTWYDAARTATSVPLSFDEALPFAALDRLAMPPPPDGEAPLCTIVLVYPDVNLGKDAPPFVRDHAVEGVVRRKWPVFGVPSWTPAECRRCGKHVRRVIALRARVAEPSLAEQQHVVFAALTHLFDGSLAFDGSIPRPAAAVVVNGDTYPEDSGETFAMKLSSELQRHNGSAVVGSVLCSDNVVVSAGFSAIDRQLTGGAGLSDRHQGYDCTDLRIEQAREVQYLPHGAFAVTASTWRKLRQVQRGGVGPRSADPLMDPAAPRPPHLEALVLDIALATAATRGVLASLQPYVLAVQTLSDQLPSFGAKKTAMRLAGAVRRVELAVNASAEVLTLARAGWHWRKQNEPAAEPLQATMLSLHCTNKVADAVVEAYDFDIPGVVAQGDGSVTAASGDEATVVPLLAFLLRAGGSLDSVQRKFYPSAKLRALADARVELGRFADAMATRKSSENKRATDDPTDSPDDDLGPGGHETVSVTAPPATGPSSAVEAVAAINMAKNASLAAAAFVEPFVAILHDRRYQFERVCSSAWPVSRWAQLNTAAASAGVPRIAVRSPGLLQAPKLDAVVPDGEALEYVTMLRYRHLHWLPLTVGVAGDDPVLARLEAEATSQFLTMGARVQWGVPCDCAGITVEAMWILSGLRKYIEVRHPNSPLCYCPGPLGNTFDTMWNTFNYGRSPLYRAQTFRSLRSPDDVVDVHVSHWEPLSAPNIVFGSEATGGDYHVMRTMFEFSRIPPEWVAPLNSALYDEIWVPCRAVADAFVASGVNATKIEIVPEPIDVETFDPDRVAPISFPVKQVTRAIIEPRPDDEVADSFKFCSVFKFEERKGWRALLEAYYTTFDRSDRVSLFIAGYLTGALPKGAHGPTDTEAIRLLVEFEAAKHGKIHRSTMPHLEVFTTRLSDNDMAQLYKACDAFVLPTLGEGWGLPVMQAMAMRLPTITTNTSGVAAFTTADTVMYVKHTERLVPERSRKLYNLPKGATWSKPNAAHLGELMRQLRSTPAAHRQALGQRAMDHVRSEFDQTSVGLEIAGRVAAIERAVRKRWKKAGRPAGKPGPGDEQSGRAPSSELPTSLTRQNT